MHYESEAQKFRNLPDPAALQSLFSGDDVELHAFGLADDLVESYKQAYFMYGQAVYDRDDQVSLDRLHRAAWAAFMQLRSAVRRGHDVSVGPAVVQRAQVKERGI